MNNCENTELENLINRVAERDSEAFAILVDKYSPMLKRMVSLYTSDEMSKEDVEDLKQEALVAFFRAIKDYKFGVGVEFGLYAQICVKNSMISYKRAISRKSKESLLGDEVMGNITDPESEVSRHIVLEENKKNRGQKIEKTLSPFENEVWPYYAHGDSSKEISAKLNVSEKSVDNAIFRIRKKIRPLLK